MKFYNAVVFDLDSTLVKIEGLDWLANRLGKLDALSKLTKQSMDGKISFQEAMKIKMATIAPSFKDLLDLGNAYSESLVEDAKEVIRAIQSLDKDVWILTGNFQPAVGKAAFALGIPKEKIICNEIYFDEEGKYKGFNIGHPLAANGGKAVMLNKYLNKQKTVFVGDGYTDLEAQKEVTLFIGYGGVVKRENIRKASNIYLLCESLSPLLKIILSNAERNTLKNNGYKKLLTKASGLATSSAIIRRPASRI
jgi:phosphoserine phosphatase